MIRPSLSGIFSRFTLSVAAACLVGGVAPVAAQQAFTPPDALIIVQPMGNQAMVTVSYSGKVNHGVAKDALSRLAKLGGWKLSTPEISDVDMRTSPQFGSTAALGIQTGATALISGAPLAANGGFILQPYIEAFRNLSTYKLLYWVGPQSGFQGLRSFDSPAVAVELTQEGGPYRYTVTNHTHQGPVPQLPLTQARTSTVASVANRRATPANHVWTAVAPVAAIAVGAGLVVFIVLRLFTRMRRGSRNRTSGERTTSRDSRYTSHV